MYRSKYKNKKTVIDGITFDSIKESKRYAELMLLLRAGEINNLKCHPFVSISINGIHICKVFADFSYFEMNKRVFEDVKSRGTLTPIS
jgi:Protein of unknown function (DUF1064)